MKRYIVKLSEEERKHLHALTHKGTCGVRKLRRAQMLMLADEGLTDEQIARALNRSVSTVEHAQARLLAQPGGDRVERAAQAMPGRTAHTA